VQVKARADTVDVDEVVRQAQRARVQALVTAPMTTNLEITDRLALAAGAARLPFLHDVPQFAADSLAVYGPDFEDIFRRAAHYVARILAGERPATMAIEEPRAFRLIVNERHARMLGLTIPPTVRLRADEVIE
jgi:putative tryptophan/tyrosine transport system substrate-binding protein